ncbi:MAG: pyruvate kinase [Candidatus Dormibacteria bacterium]
MSSTHATRRRTKIVATIGPASDREATLRGMIAAGMDAARLGLAHGPVSESVERLHRVRSAAAAAGREIGIIADLPGPKIRAGAYPDGGVFVAEGDVIELCPSAGREDMSSAQRTVVDHQGLIDDLRVDDIIALGDGGVRLSVVDIGDGRATSVVRNGGHLQGRPGVNLPAGRLSSKTPTPEDLRLLEVMCDAGVDAVAVSFVQGADDIRAVRRATGPDGPMLIAKIETQDAVDGIEEIIETADGVMVARGDLGVRLPLEDVPHLQKRIIRAGVSYGRPVITATQMLESMVLASVPTRAEVTDVANAVFDGTSALMLSGETAVGHDPVGVVATMSRIAGRAELEFDYGAWGTRLGRQQVANASRTSTSVRITAAITAAAWRAAAFSDAAAIICCTNTGATARAISRFRPTAPLLAYTPSVAVARQLSMAWGVNAVATEQYQTADEIVWFAVKDAVERGIAHLGEIVVVLVGSPEDDEPTTDVLRMVRIR